jgi:hypothetical protein
MRAALDHARLHVPLSSPPSVMRILVIFATTLVKALRLPPLSKARTEPLPRDPVEPAERAARAATNGHLHMQVYPLDDI